MGEKYLNAIDKPVPGLIIHADAGLHIDRVPQFLQTPLWAASGLAPTKWAQAACVGGDLRSPGWGLWLEVPPTSFPFALTLGSGLCSQEGVFLAGPSLAQPQVHGDGAQACLPPDARTRRSPAAAESSSRTGRGVTPRAAVTHRALGEYKLIKRFPALSQGPRVRPEEEEEEKETNVQLIL